MPVFVHITSHRNVDGIRRRGIVPEKRSVVFALPVTRNFQVSHQWLRELKRHGGGTMVAVYFRLPDDEPVRISHYGKRAKSMTAAQAAGVMFAVERNDPAAARERDAQSKAVARGKELPSSPEGYEVQVERAIARSEILRIKAVPQVVGWRYRPGANGTPPCACVCCEGGTWGFGRLLRQVVDEEAGGGQTQVRLSGRIEPRFQRLEQQRQRRGRPLR